jgi:hypothetical protein
MDCINIISKLQKLYNVPFFVVQEDNKTTILPTKNFKKTNTIINLPWVTNFYFLYFFLNF